MVVNSDVGSMVNFFVKYEQKTLILIAKVNYGKLINSSNIDAQRPTKSIKIRTCAS
jgi:hypothetical protein